jgi:peptidoglycan hydrolase-like protein with peptidoglycan-binding domain
MASSVSRSPSRPPVSAPRTSPAERTESTRSTRGAQTTQPGGGTRATGHSGRSSFTPATRTQPGGSTGSLRPGSRGDAVRSLQDRLRGAGFDPGRSDGVYGQNTERAVRDFQGARGLKVDGIVGRRTRAALNGADRMDRDRPAANRPAPNRPETNGTTRTDPNRPRTNGGVDGTARLDNQPRGPGLTTGTITVRGRSYQFTSGSSSLFSVPRGTYHVRRHQDERTGRPYSRDGVGFSFILEDARRGGSDRMYDARAGRDRTELRIHPDGGARGTAGCIGLVGDRATLEQFRRDMLAEIRRNGGTYTLRVD